MSAIAEREQAGSSSAEINHSKEEGRERIEPEMRADPREPERQRECGRRGRVSEKPGKSAPEAQHRHEETRPIDHGAGKTRAACRNRKAGDAQQDRDAAKCDDDHPCPFSLTPRPPLVLALPWPISTMPAASSAPTSFISESTLPRMTSSLPSMRWIVGSDNPDILASL